jgi:DNA-binding transcriptional regulator YdaS (Cro superfamily)
MDLRTYLTNAERGAAATLARQIGVSPVMVSQWAGGVKPTPTERCADIEKATEGAVKRWDLRPDDWHRIWPELIGADGAPAVPEAAREVQA